METTALILLWIFGVDFAGILLTEIVHQIRAWKYSFAGKHVVITGGSSGLGLEMAKQIASESAKVTIIARNQTQLEKAKDEITSYCQSKGLMTPLVEIEQADICNREEIQKAINASAQTNGAVDVIICNAGMAKTGYAFGQTIQDYDDSVRINYMGTVNTLFGVVPRMIQRNHGEIYLVGSTCSMLSYIGYCAYSPSKYAVKGLADGLRMELQRCNIRVGCIYPPNMDTPCLKKENETKPEEGLYVEKHLESLFSSADIARKAIRHIKRGEPQIYCDLDAWAVSMINGSIGPHNNIFVSILFAAPAILFTSAFRWILLGIYRMKQFVGPEKRKKWVAGSSNSEIEDRVFASLLHVGWNHFD